MNNQDSNSNQTFALTTVFITPKKLSLVCVANSIYIAHYNDSGILHSNNTKSLVKRFSTRSITNLTLDEINVGTLHIKTRIDEDTVTPYWILSNPNQKLSASCDKMKDCSLAYIVELIESIIKT